MFPLSKNSVFFDNLSILGWLIWDYYNEQNIFSEILSYYQYNKSSF